MDERTLRVLEFFRVRQRLAAATASPLGEEVASALLPSGDRATVEEWLQETTEARLLLAAGEVPLRALPDVRPVLHRARIGAVLRAEELLEILHVLRAARLTKAYVLERADRVPHFAAAVREVPSFELLEAAIERAISEDGSVLDSASAELARIRRDIRATQERLRAKLEEIVRSERWGRMLQDPVVTVRGDRYVVPVKQAYVSQFPGILHDQSASGATAFMEPLVAVQMGNRLRELEGAQAREVERVLAALSSRVGERADEAQTTVAILGRVDFALAKARLAEELDAVQPVLQDAPALDFRRARHPLLIPRRGEPRTVVPIDVRLGDDFRTLVITGPNTGGKTVTLKTIGLLTLMAQAGLHIPVDLGSRAGLFEEVFADIGDEQSIEHSLSTFSSHMTAIVRILDRASPTSLVLLDEIGAGTDPTEGSALARAIIETLHERGARTVVTTHYGELKALAYQTPGIENASVEFDVETLRPTYRLRIGTPGRSNAFVIASRLGLADEVVSRAKSYLAAELLAVDDVLAGIERDQRTVASERARAAELRRDLEELRARYEQRLRSLEVERDQVLERARSQARQIVEQARAEVDAILVSLRAERAERAAEAARRRLRTIEESLRPAPGVPRPPPPSVEPGAPVHVASLNAGGTVAALGERDVEVQIGPVKVRVQREDLRAAQPAAPAGRAPMPTGTAEAAVVPSRLDLRGQTAEEAASALEKYLDSALLAGLPRAVIVHGKGTGALRRAVHQTLSAHPEVRFRLAPPHEGGEGATIVEFVT
ncbi:MAG: endonuclease MutS2 [Armatimonadota bacterium]|nr:endonuclease MutS2 [Armatimonadota bacterium]MDR5698002.1 endonuclease MutS2 [Armatimonadota bacterium]